MSERPYNFQEDFYVQPKKCKTETFVSGCRPSDANPEPQRSTFRRLTDSQEPHVCSALIKIEFEKDDPFSDIDTKDIPPMQLSPSCFPTNVEVMSNGGATLVLDSSPTPTVSRLPLEERLFGHMPLTRSHSITPTHSIFTAHHAQRCGNPQMLPVWATYYHHCHILSACGPIQEKSIWAAGCGSVLPSSIPV